MTLHRPFLHRHLLTLSLSGSLLVMILLYVEGISPGGQVLTLATYLLWWAGVRMLNRGDSNSSEDAGAEDRITQPRMTDIPAQPLDHFYARMFANLEFGWARLQQDHEHALTALHNVDRSLGKALDLVHSTGLLAANAMINAAECGEVGRGFVTVSRDLAQISVQSQEDLGYLRNRIRQFVAELGRQQLLVEHPLAFWLVSRAGLPITDLVKLRTATRLFQHELNRLNERYRRTPQADVRWLQLGDAVKRLLSELINTLYQLELHLQDVLSDMRLLQLGQGTRQQIVEIKDRIEVFAGRDGAPQKFMF